MIEWELPLLGGMLIGASASLMLLFNGKVTGISGIFYGCAFDPKNDSLWKASFIVGLLLAGVTLGAVFPEKLAGAIDSEIWTVAIAGLLVGFGTRLGSGCTSGHGVCGVSRWSFRSIIATLTFMAAGIVAVALFRWFGVLGL